jgi:CheY-like chemotaxis protein
LRLAVCQNLVEGFGGVLRIESRAKSGFRIELRYPLAAEALQRNKPAAPRHHSNGVSHAATALVIDSDTAVQDTLLQLLAERGYRVIPVSTAEEGLDLCEQAHFDCVFFDIRPSVGGLEVYDRIRSRVSRLIFLAETALTVDNGDFSGKDCAVLRKPVDARELDRLLESLTIEPAESCDNTEKQPADVG